MDRHPHQTYLNMMSKNVSAKCEAQSINSLNIVIFFYLSTPAALLLSSSLLLLIQAAILLSNISSLLNLSCFLSGLPQNIFVLNKSWQKSKIQSDKNEDYCQMQIQKKKKNMFKFIESGRKNFAICADHITMLYWSVFICTLEAKMQEKINQSSCHELISKSDSFRHSI